MSNTLKLYKVSIRSPHRSKGRPSSSTICASLSHVSIRSPHRSKGRRSGSDFYVYD